MTTTIVQSNELKWDSYEIPCEIPNEKCTSTKYERNDKTMTIVLLLTNCETKLNCSNVDRNKYLDEQSLNDTNNNQVATLVKQKIVDETTGKVFISCM